MTDTADRPAPRTDAELLLRFQTTKRGAPSSATLGARVERVDQAAQEVEITFEVKPEFCNAVGQAQGGFLTAMLDEVMAIAGVVASGVTASIASLEIKTSYLRPASPGALRGVGRVVKWGRTICFLEGELFDPEGRVVARASSSAMPVPYKRREG